MTVVGEIGPKTQSAPYDLLSYHLPKDFMLLYWHKYNMDQVLTSIVRSRQVLSRKFVPQLFWAITKVTVLPGVKEMTIEFV